MNTLPNPLHSEWVDSMADWAEHNALAIERTAQLEADRGPLERHEGVLYTAPQGRVEQGWPARRCSPEMAVWDSTQDDPPREAMTGAEAALLALIYAASVSFVCWLIATIALAWSH